MYQLQYQSFLYKMESQAAQYIIRSSYSSLLLSFISTYFAILPSSYYVLSIWRICQGHHAVEMALLLQHVGLTLPLPHQELPQTCKHSRINHNHEHKDPANASHKTRNGKQC